MAQGPVRPGDVDALSVDNEAAEDANENGGSGGKVDMVTGGG